MADRLNYKGQPLRLLSEDQVHAIQRAIETVDFIEPCHRCASRERVALVHLIIDQLDRDAARQLVAEYGVARMFDLWARNS